MAFKLRDLSVLAYANGFTLWHYKAREDDLRTVGAPVFFNDAGDMMSAGDHIHVSGAAGGSVLVVVPNGNGLKTVPIGIPAAPAAQAPTPEAA
jgi:hypothetical protein